MAPQLTHRDPWIRLFHALWITYTIALMAKGLLDPTKHTVVHIYQRAGRDWWAGAHLYYKLPHMGHYFYSPLFAAFMGPFALAPRIGAALWGLLNVAVLYRALQVLARNILPERWSERRIALFVLIAGVGSMRWLWVNQANALLMALAILAADAFQRGRSWTAATLLAIAFWIKVWPVAFAALLIATEPRRLAGRYVVCVAALGAVPFLTAPPGYVVDQYAAWYEYLLGPGTHRLPCQRDVSVLAALVSHPLEPAALRWIGVATGAATLAWCLAMKRRFGRGRLLTTALLAIWPAWQLLFGPRTERATYSLIGPMAAWAMLHSIEHGRGRWLAVTAWVSIVFGALFIEKHLRGPWPVAVGMLPLAVVLYVVWLMRYPFRAGRHGRAYDLPPAR